MNVHKLFTILFLCLSGCVSYEQFETSEIDKNEVFLKRIHHSDGRVKLVSSLVTPAHGLLSSPPLSFNNGKWQFHLGKWNSCDAIDTIEFNDDIMKSLLILSNGAGVKFICKPRDNQLEGYWMITGDGKIELYPFCFNVDEKTGLGNIQTDYFFEK